MSRLRLTNIRCFEEAVVDLTPPSQSAPSWTLILGDNGVGKTTILRAIAMALCDETGASGLLTELAGTFVRDDCDEGLIELQLRSDEDTMFTITTTLSRTDSGNEEVKQSVEPSDTLPRRQLFACGYGAAYGTMGSEVYEKYRMIDAVYSLFNYSARLQNPENVLFRISHSDVDLGLLLKQIDHVLMLAPGSTELGSSGLRVKSPWGDFVPAGAIGDGYASVLAWICDMLGWALLRGSFDPNVRGIVLLDEIEQHLHPSWQRKIIALLSESFPGVQFIATTHSPLVAIGATGLPDDSCQLLLLNHGEQGTVVRSGLKAPRGRRADQVLTSTLFGLPSTSSDDLVDAIEKYAAMRGMESPDSHTERMLRELRTYLIPRLGSAETSLQRTVEQAVRETLDRMSKAGATTQPREALSFEMQRQIRDLFGPKDDNL